MTRRFYVGPGVVRGERFAIDGALAHRLASVLRLREGERLVLFAGDGVDAVVQIEASSPKAISGFVIERVSSPPEARTAIHLYQSITKGDRFDWLVEKATELGVARIIPLITARATVRTGEGNRHDRWQRIAIEAAEQCGRGAVPAIDPPQTFAEALQRSAGLRLLPYEAAGNTSPSIQDALNSRIDELFAAGAISIFIGPEGGYDPSEIDTARAARGMIVTLGSRVLRSETAGLVASTLALQACGELG